MDALAFARVLQKGAAHGAVDPLYGLSVLLCIMPYPVAPTEAMLMLTCKKDGFSTQHAIDMDVLAQAVDPEGMLRATIDDMRNAMCAAMTAPPVEA